MADVESIGAVTDPMLRNLRITHAYHRLALAVADRVGPGANWCTFATWASKQAGQTIRKDDLGVKIELAFSGSDVVPVVVDRLRDLRRELGRRVEADAVLRALREAWAPLLIVARVADAVSRGNKKVFEEVGREFARYLAIGADPAELDRFCEGLRPGDPPDGQRLLAEAFRGYHRLRALDDPRQRAERMFLANLMIGMHEQTRLQPEIAEALDTSVSEPHEVKQRIVDALVPPSERASVRVRRAVLDRILAPVIERLRAAARSVITAELMTLALPGVVLRLGRDVTGQFPESLRTLTDPELTKFLVSVDPTPDTPLGSGTVDWAVLNDRMHFIADLFRTRHEDASLAQPPFTPAQLGEIAAGRRPDGAL